MTFIRFAGRKLGFPSVTASLRESRGHGSERLARGARHARRRTRGAAVVEMALLLVPLILLVFGMTELGRAFYYYNGVLKSTRDAARYLSTVAPGQGEALAKCLAVYGTQCSAGAQPLVPGMTVDQVGISHRTSVPLVLGGVTYGSADAVTVTIPDFPFHSFMPMKVHDFFFSPISCTMRQASS